MKLLVIDCGTTNCRMRLLDHHTLVVSIKKPVGAKDVAISGSSDPLKAALKESYMQLCTLHPKLMSQVEAVIASGMITSNAGLYEVAHVLGPVDERSVAARMERQLLSEVIPYPILFVPGIKFIREQEEESDMMRGEETEIYGYLSRQERPGQDNACQLVMHYGSHHKWIKLREQSIEGCLTSVSGELLMAVSQHTILKDSVLSLDEVVPELPWVKKGLQAANTYGTGHALFSVRTLGLLSGHSKQAVTSFLLGVVIAMDLSMLTPHMLEGVKRIVLYGKPLFPSLVAPILVEAYPGLQIEVVSEQESDLLSMYGAARLYQYYIGGMPSC
ncbi:hypothetical protein B1748_16440 [Paenibacillus sp. MY03]|uniref:2-dehydro-3-deoxygalactonokinase n=1 Tax=Paenibacillaceae TaxID=186822 RepID=UPI000B3C66EB|nr:MULTISPECIES: 2-dehydro-3-deoxygalactonokinase [Paenibacillaceae]OUS75688.1 hypothetical protein B1748_16440 [Paenibacillus sp. MY03]QTH40839.1 2-dehydro-3-deoxygalactonokinase [Cohnella sp. LGH]